MGNGRKITSILLSGEIIHAPFASLNLSKTREGNKALQDAPYSALLPLLLRDARQILTQEDAQA